jgi:hypothetical protein
MAGRPDIKLTAMKSQCRNHGAAEQTAARAYSEAGITKYPAEKPQARMLSFN